MAVGSIQESFKSVFYLFVLCAFDGEAVHAVGCVWRSEEDFESFLPCGPGDWSQAIGLGSRHPSRQFSTYWTMSLASVLKKGLWKQIKW